jgi:hypothetical protein
MPKSEDNFSYIAKRKFTSCYNINFVLAVYGEQYKYFVELCMKGNSYAHFNGKYIQ